MDSKDQSNDVPVHRHAQRASNQDTENLIPAVTTHAESAVKKQKDVNVWPEPQIKFLMLLCFGIKDEKDQSACFLKFVSRSCYPCIVMFELAVYFRFYYKYDRTYQQDCINKFFVCLFLDIMIIWSHQQASRCDPGFIEISPRRAIDGAATDDQLENNSSQERCRKCQAPKTQLTHHCKSCDRCVFLMDHHCWWTNNCVGYTSFKPFALFALYTALLTIFGVSTILQNFATVNQEKQQGLQGILDGFLLLLSPQNLVFAMHVDPLKYLDWFLLQFSVMLGGMAVVMVAGITWGILKNESQVEAYKRIHDRSGNEKRLLEKKPKRSLRQAISFISGQNWLSPWLLIPINTRPPMSMNLVFEATDRVNDCLDSAETDTRVQKCDRLLVTSIL